MLMKEKHTESVSWFIKLFFLDRNEGDASPLPISKEENEDRYNSKCNLK